MKNKAMKGLVCIICISGLYYVNRSTQTKMVNLTFENIEALANGESGTNYKCFGYGDIDCHGYKVYDKYENFSLGIE